jgi:hypothetical protein
VPSTALSEHNVNCYFTHLIMFSLLLPLWNLVIGKCVTDAGQSGYPTLHVVITSLLEHMM